MPQPLRLQAIGRIDVRHEAEFLYALRPDGLQVVVERGGIWYAEDGDVVGLGHVFLAGDVVGRISGASSGIRGASTVAECHRLSPIIFRPTMATPAVPRGSAGWRPRTAYSPQCAACARGLRARRCWG